MNIKISKKNRELFIHYCEAIENKVGEGFLQFCIEQRAKNPEEYFSKYKPYMHLNNDNFHLYLPLIGKFLTECYPSCYTLTAEGELLLKEIYGEIDNKVL